MKCKNVKLYRKVRVKPFKHTCKVAANLLIELIGEEVIVVNKCVDNQVIYVKKDLKEKAFYPIHRKDLKSIK